MPARRATRISLALLCLLAAVASGCDRNSEQARRTVNKEVKKALPAAAAGAWHGSVTVHRTASGSLDDPSNNEFSTTSHNVGMTLTVNIDVGKVTRASIDYSESTQTQFHHDYDAYTISGSQLATLAANGPSGEARVNISFYDDGRYTIDYGAQGIDGQGNVTGSSIQRCKPGRDPQCVDKTGTVDDTWPEANVGGVGGGVEGRVDRSNRRVLTGSYSEPFELKEGVSGRTVVSWNLTR